MRLNNAEVSDAVIPTLARLTRLKSLTLNLAELTDHGMDALVMAMPNCRINGVDPGDTGYWERKRAFRLSDEQLAELRALLAERPRVRVVEMERMRHVSVADKSVLAPADQLKIGHPSLRDKALAITETLDRGDTLESSWTVEFIEDNQLKTHDYTEQIKIHPDGLRLRWSDHRGSQRFRGKWRSDTRTIYWQRTNSDDASIHEVTYRFLDDHRCLIEQWRTSEGQRLLVMQGESRSASPSDVIEQLEFLGADLELNRQGEVTGVNLHKAYEFQGRHAAYFEQTKQLRKLDLSFSGFTDWGLMWIGQVDNLEVLKLLQKSLIFIFIVILILVRLMVVVIFLSQEER